MLIKSQPYSKISDRYKSSIQWLEDIGLHIGNKRLDRYSKSLDYLSNNYKDLKVEEYRKFYPEAVNTLFEVTAITEIFESLGDEKLENLSGAIEKLKKAITGPDYVGDETSSSQEARNYLFELMTMAKFHQPDKNIHAMLNSETDTGINFLDKKIYIECKRIHSKKKLEKNIRDASNQLKKVLAFKKDKGKRGIIALDISKLINPEFELLVQPNDQKLLMAINNIMDVFIKDKNEIWNNVLKEKHTKIMGVFIRFSFMGVSEERDLLTSCSQWGVNPRVDINNFDKKYLQILAEVIGH